MAAAAKAKARSKAADASSLSDGAKTKKKTKTDEHSSSSDSDSDNKNDNVSKNSSSSSSTSSFVYFVMALLVGLLAFVLHKNTQQQQSSLVDTSSTTSEPSSSSSSYFDSWNSFDWKEFYNELQTHVTTTEWTDRPGAILRTSNENASAKHPVVIIPGFTTSGLEVWGTEECGRKYFRTRFWGTLDQASALIQDKDCWRRHMTLDPYTGDDPSPHVKLRPTEGFVAGDYFMAPYWVWGKLIENLNEVGYNPNNMALLSFDWRLAFRLTEERDGYFTKLKYTVETFHGRSGQKVVLLAHSMGSTVVHYFFKWVTTAKADGGGGGGKDWVDTHVESYVNIAGALLGVPKAVSALLSGEMKDTAALLGSIGDIAEHIFGRKLRKDMFATWGALWAMLPKGGDAVWNTVPNGQADLPMLTLTDPNTDITDDDLKNVSDNPVVRKRLLEFASQENHTAADLVDMLLTWGAGYGPDISAAKFHRFEKKGNKIAEENWHDVTVTPLPFAPSTKIYCLYGVDSQTEVGYYYRTSWNGRQGGGGSDNNNDNDKCSDDKCDPPFLLDTTVNNAETNTQYGVRTGNGDATVPLVSLGYPCVGGWATKELNPGGTKVITREYQDKSVFQANDPLRGGPEASIHVDILGNRQMTFDILKIVTGQANQVETHIVSDIEQVSKQINEKLF